MLHPVCEQAEHLHSVLGLGQGHDQVGQASRLLQCDASKRMRTFGSHAVPCPCALPPRLRSGPTCSINVNHRGKPPGLHSYRAHVDGAQSPAWGLSPCRTQSVLLGTGTHACQPQRRRPLKSRAAQLSSSPAPFTDENAPLRHGTHLLARSAPSRLGAWPAGTCPGVRNPGGRRSTRACQVFTLTPRPPHPPQAPPARP